ncbi:hypothetical protein JCM3766R1_005530 [Sporobolomyces carnicolor]
MTSPSQSSVPPTDIGTHCALPTCNALDFLPIECAYCSSRYCRQHATPSSHQCTADPASSSNIPSSSSTTSTSAVTTRTGPELKDLLPDAKRNKLSTGAHSAALSDAGKPLSKQQLALAALKKSIDARKGESKQPAGGSRGGAKVKNASSAIELMKLKQRATSADPRRRDGDVAMTDRWYMAVKLVDGAAASETSTREVWLRKDVSGGKALDLFADLFKVSNVNHLANASPPERLFLTASSQPATPLDLSARIDALVANGSTIVLLRGATGL